MKAKAIILNYAISAVEVAELPDDLFQSSDGLMDSERIEDYLADELGYYLEEINYMIVDGDCPVYRWDNNEPINFI